MAHLEPQQPQQWESLLAGYVLGDLTPEEVVLVKQHLATDPDLAIEVNRLQATLALLPLSLPSTAPPQNLRQSLLQTASQASPKPANWLQRPRLWIGVIGSAAAFLVAGLGLSNYRLHQQLADAQAEVSRYQEAIALLRQPNNRLLALKGMSPTVSSSGSLVIAPQKQAAVLTLQNVASLPPSKVYRLWAFVDGRKVDCAEFQPNSEGKVFLRLPLNNWADATSVVVTIEPFQETPDPTGEMVMTGSQLL